MTDQERIQDRIATRLAIEERALQPGKAAEFERHPDSDPQEYRLPKSEPTECHTDHKRGYDVTRWRQNHD
jgi:hypothetical protein